MLNWHDMNVNSESFKRQTFFVLHQLFYFRMCYYRDVKGFVGSPAQIRTCRSPPCFTGHLDINARAVGTDYQL